MCGAGSFTRFSSSLGSSLHPRLFSSSGRHRPQKPFSWGFPPHHRLSSSSSEHHRFLMPFSSCPPLRHRPSSSWGQLNRHPFSSPSSPYYRRPHHLSSRISPSSLSQPLWTLLALLSWRFAFLLSPAPLAVISTPHRSVLCIFGAGRYFNPAECKQNPSPQWTSAGAAPSAASYFPAQVCSLAVISRRSTSSPRAPS